MPFFSVASSSACGRGTVVQHTGQRVRVHSRRARAHLERIDKPLVQPVVTFDALGVPWCNQKGRRQLINISLKQQLPLDKEVSYELFICLCVGHYVSYLLLGEWAGCIWAET